jgi:hypothetical protein
VQKLQFDLEPFAPQLLRALLRLAAQLLDLALPAGDLELVSTENLIPDIVVMECAKDGERFNASGPPRLAQLCPMTDAL